MDQISNSKKLSIGSISLILSIFASMFSFTFWNEKELGVHILNLIGVSFPIVILNYHTIKSSKFIAGLFNITYRKFIVYNDIIF